MREHENEPVWGLPERPPEGEQILWQGKPDWRSLARRALHLPLLAGYFALLLGIHALTAMLNGVPPLAAVMHALWFAPFALAALVLVLVIAWFAARSTAYTITNRRLVMRLGVALPITANLPFKVIQSADVTVHADGSGDISLSLIATQKISYLFFWPHVRPWHYRRAQPTLRSIPEAAAVAQLLSRALATEAAMPVLPMPSSIRAGAAGEAQQHPAAA